ncbi:MAG: Zinc-type alcohol dehydrogenase-like protein [Candidatus Heimdallarchaeota archaeon LC_2]|nr:MAG: Zinc-type alcohol dehydrogenase-like protein [Candidatus Heimdallarchaeota archaeon LC_2]
MKAVTCENYGPPEILQLKEIDKPILETDEMLIKVHAASVNTIDIFFRKGIKVFFGLSRLASGIRKPKRKVTGFDVAGEIVQIGEDITKFKVGDQIYGIARTGSCAEYAKVSERGIAIKPSNMTYSEAAAVPGAGLTALQFLRDLGNIQNGQNVLIYGASGGIGTYAVQLAKNYDVEITAVCSGKNEQLVKNLGADRVIDYTKEDFTKNNEKYDIIFDTIHKASLSKWKTALKEDGIFMTSGSPSMHIIRLYLKVLGNRFRKKKLRTLTTKTNTKDLAFLAKLIEDGKIKSIIDKSYSLEDTAKAQRYYEKGHTAGKVVINIIPDSTK